MRLSSGPRRGPAWLWTKAFASCFASLWNCTRLSSRRRAWGARRRRGAEACSTEFRDVQTRHTDGGFQPHLSPGSQPARQFPGWVGGGVLNLCRNTQKIRAPPNQTQNPTQKRKAQQKKIIISRSSFGTPSKWLITLLRSTIFKPNFFDFESNLAKTGLKQILLYDFKKIQMECKWQKC